MTCSHNQRLRQWIGALTLIVLGVLMILRNMGMIEAKVYQLLLPTLAIGVGIWSLLNKRHYAAGILMAAVGIYFLLPRLVSGIGWTPVWPSWLTFWPLACILLGVTLLTYLFRPTYYTRSYFNNGVDETVSEAQDGFVEVNNSFGSVRHIVLDTVFKGARIRTKFSGTVLDLTRTTLGEGETYIDVDMSLSGLELRLPDGWMVVTDPLSLNLAGIEDKRYYRMASDPSRRLVIRGGMSLSGIEIKS
jgi:hypothetical protein